MLLGIKSTKFGVYSENLFCAYILLIFHVQKQGKGL